MEVETLRKRCLCAKKKLEDVVAEKAADKDSSMLWIKQHNEIIAYYLETALSWLKDGHTTYQKTFQHPRTNAILFHKGTKIIDKVLKIEKMLKEYGVSVSDSERSGRPSPKIRSVNRKRHRSDDLGIDLNEQRKQRYISPPSRGRGFQFSAKRAIAATKGRLKRTRHVHFATASLVDYLDDIEANPKHATELSDDGDGKVKIPASPTSPLVTDASSSSQTTLTNLVTEKPSSPTTAKKPCGRPPKHGPAKSNGSRKVKTPPETLTTPTIPSRPIWMGRPRPAHMPSIPCPEGLNPVVWNAMSYSCQKTRLEGLRLLAEMPSEESE